MEKRKSILKGYNDILFGNLSKRQLTIGEYHKFKKKKKCHREHEEDD